MSFLSLFKQTHADALNGLQRLDAETRRQVVLDSSVFPRSESIRDEAALVELDYDGTAQGFSNAIDRANKNMELKALGTHLAIKELLDTMRDGTTFLDLGLDMADFIVIQRLGRHILRIKRNSDNETKSGRALFIELNDVRARAADIVKITKYQAVDQSLAIIGAAVLLSIPLFILALEHFMSSFRNSRKL